MRARALVLGLFALLITGPAAFAVEKKLPPWEKPLRVGRYLYLENCTVCHEINKAESKKLGPALFRLFQNDKTPLTGVKPTPEYVKFKIQLGGDVMPAFVNKLTDEQIDKIVGFIRSKK